MPINAIVDDLIFPTKGWSSSGVLLDLPYTDINGPISDTISNAGGSATLVSRNTAILPSSASSVNDYYNGYIIKISRKNLETGRIRTQEKKIVGYVGSTRVITIDDIWETDFIPVPGDDIEIYPPARDRRSTINPAIQTLDYMTSKTYGRGLDVFEDLHLPSWLNSGRICDEGSDVTIKTLVVQNPSVGSVYKYPSTGDILWQGVVSSSNGRYITFTDIIGKLSNKWNSWKNFPINSLIYVDNRLYKATSGGVFATKPVHTSGTVANLQYVGSLTLTSTNGGIDLNLIVAGNPVRNINDKGQEISGYSLYDCDEINFWRLVGWDEHSQRYATRHQTNVVVDTSISLFDNTNSFLEHFNGILRYTGNKYYLDIETKSDNISSSVTEPRHITADYIIDKIKLADDGSKKSYNSLTAAFPDPGNKFESKNISFFNSDYLKADKNSPKKGNLTLPGITNYYNTRMLADSYLNKSRYGLTISFNMAPRGTLLLAGSIIELEYPRYNWVDKKFRISSITHQPDCSVDIVADEYDDSFYSISNLSRPQGTGRAAVGVQTSIEAPSGLHASNVSTGDENYSTIELSWVNGTTFNSTKNIYTEIYRSSSPDMFITCTDISSNVLQFSSDHNLLPGDSITPQENIAGLVKNTKYFVKDIISTSELTLSETINGSIVGLVDQSSISLSIMTASLIATLPIPTNKYSDTFAGIDSRVEKYYWVRHKVIS